MTTFTTEDRIEALKAIEGDDEIEFAQTQEQQYNQERKANMYWNNRVVKETITYLHEGKEVTEYYYEISEVYYNDKDEPCGYCKSTAGGETFDDMRAVYSRMAEAFKFDVLDAKTDFNHKFNEDDHEEGL